MILHHGRILSCIIYFPVGVYFHGYEWNNIGCKLNETKEVNRVLIPHAFFSCFFISLRTKKSLWQAIADVIFAEFGERMTGLQIDNKWRSPERCYKRTKTKNSASGHSRVTCECEEQVRQTCLCIISLQVEFLS